MKPGKASEFNKICACEKCGISFNLNITKKCPVCELAKIVEELKKVIKEMKG